jgi:hypothetical protein
MADAGAFGPSLVLVGVLTLAGSFLSLTLKSQQG